MVKLYIPVGIPGCGKSTFTRVLSHVNLRTVSSDAIRAELLKDATDQTRNNDVFDTFHKRIEDHLLDGLDVVADATNLRDFARGNLRTIADRVGAETHLIVFTNLNQAVTRNQKRDRIVPAETMVKMLEQYEQAMRDIANETYSTVTYLESVF